jgi:hypothetical protein
MEHQSTQYNDRANGIESSWTKEIRQGQAAEDARSAGKPAPVAKTFRVIPADEKDFSKYEPEEIKAYLARKKSGGRLMR